MKKTKENIREAIRKKCEQGGRVSRKDLYEYLNRIFGTSLVARRYPPSSDHYWFSCSQKHEEDYVVKKVLDS